MPFRKFWESIEWGADVWCGRQLQLSCIAAVDQLPTWHPLQCTTPQQCRPAAEFVLIGEASHGTGGPSWMPLLQAYKLQQSTQLPVTRPCSTASRERQLVTLCSLPFHPTLPRRGLLPHARGHHQAADRGARLQRRPAGF